MNFFPDTSFLCALYREQDNSTVARAFISHWMNHWEFRLQWSLSSANL